LNFTETLDIKHRGGILVGLSKLPGDFCLMIIQCPGCVTSYRIKDMLPGQRDAHITCPKCACHFTLQAPHKPGDSPTVNAGAAVLLVDDAPFFREMIADLLMPLNLNLRCAVNANEALTALAQSSFVLMLIDLNLPDRNGLELIREIRCHPQGKNLRILAMSGVYRREQDGLEAIRAGADDFLNKSFRPEELRARVRKFLP